MNAKLVVVDTSVLILLTAPSQPADPEARTLRRERAAAAMQELRDDGCRFLLPAPAIVELAVYEQGEAIADRILARLGGSQVEPLELLAARAAGLALRKVLRERQPGESKGQIKFDALIAGIAHRKEARFLATANPRDFEKHLRAIGSAVEVLDVAAPKQHAGQLRLIDRIPK